MFLRLRSTFVLCVPLALLGCGPGRNAFAPQCPSARLIPALADMTRYAGPGPAHDVTDLILQARVIGVNGACFAGDEKAVLPAKVQVTLQIQRGPAMRGREADVPVFLAVTEGDSIRDKHVFAVHLAFPPNVDRLTITSPDIDLDLPVSAEKTGASYGVIAGFQLTPEELELNRRGCG
jgi:hypothetical protein